MCPTYRRSLLVNPDDPLSIVPIESAMVAACALPLVLLYGRVLENLAAKQIVPALKYLVEKSAYGASALLRNAANSSLMKRISPTFSASDEKIDDACIKSGKFLEKQLVRATSLTCYLSTSTFAIATTLLMVPIFSIVSAALYAYKLLAYDAKIVSRHCVAHIPRSPTLSLETLVEVGLTLRNICEVALCLLTIPLVVAAAAVCLMCTPFVAPIYTLSSTFGLDNRFNMRNYEDGIGTAQGYILGLDNGAYMGSAIIPPAASKGLLKCVKFFSQGDCTPNFKFDSPSISAPAAQLAICW